MLTFEGDAAFVRNVVVTGDNWLPGKAGAVSNTKTGSILFKGKLTVLENEAEVSFEGTYRSIRFGDICYVVGTPYSRIPARAESCLTLVSPPAAFTVARNLNNAQVLSRYRMAQGQL